MGLREAAQTSPTIRMDFASFADYREPMLAGQGTAGAYLQSLTDEQRPPLERRLRLAYCAGAADFLSRAVASTGSAAVQYPSKLFSIPVPNLTACVPAPVSPVSGTSGLSQPERVRMKDERDDEAEKAIAPAPLNIACYRWRGLSINCAE